MTTNFGRLEPTLGSDLAALPPMSTAREDSSELYELAVGEKNSNYYLSRFERFDREGTKLGWHWPAFFFTFWWLLYRKMWGKAALYFFLPYLVFMAIGLLATALPKLAVVIYVAYVLGLFIVPALVSNAGYYRHCRRLIASARNTSANPQAQFAVVASKGGTSNVALIFVTVMAGIAGVGILAAIALPAYQDYTMRTKAIKALRFGRVAAASVGDYYQARKTLPGSLVEAQPGLALPPDLQDIQLNTSNGIIRLVLSSGPVNGRTFQLVPSADPTGRLSWACRAVDVRADLLPVECRG